MRTFWYPSSFFGSRNSLSNEKSDAVLAVLLSAPKCQFRRFATQTFFVLEVSSCVYKSM